MNTEFSFVTARSRAHWEQWTRRNVDISDEGVRLATTPTLTPTDLQFTAVDVAVSGDGNVTVLDDTGGVSVYVRDSQQMRSLSLSGSETVGFERPSIVTTTADTTFIIDEVGTVAAFSRRRRQLLWAESVVIRKPITAVGEDRQLYVLDGGRTDGEGAVFRAEADERPRRIVSGLDAPTDLSVDTTGTVTVLDSDEGRPVLRRYESAATETRPGESTIRLALDFEPRVVCSRSPETVLLSGTTESGDPRTVCYWLADGSTQRLTGFEAHPERLLRDTGGDAYVATTADEGAVWLLAESQENRKDPETTRYEGDILGRLDSGEDGMAWHRMTFEFDRQTAGTHIEIQYYTSDGDIEGVDDLSAITGLTAADRERLQAAEIEGLWEFILLEPGELARMVGSATVGQATNWLREAHTALEAVFDQRAQRVSTHNPEDILLDDADGRYLHVNIGFVGSRTSSPRLRSLRAYCPRQSYLRYLPEVYQDAADRTPFLGQFLSIFETILVDIEAEIADVTRFFDPHEVPADYLSWLNEWLAVEIGDTWPREARRELLARAPELYRMRGTRRGLLALLEIYFEHIDVPGVSWTVEDHVILLEYDDLECINDPETKRQYERLLGHPQRFLLLIDAEIGAQHVHAINRIVDAEKPAHTDGQATSLRRRLQLDQHTYLGINATLPKRRFELGQSALGDETGLVE